MKRVIVAVVFLLLCSSAAAAEIRSTLIDAQQQFEQDHYEQALKLYKQADEADHARNGDGASGHDR